MQKITLIEVSPSELTNLIKEELRPELENIVKQLNSNQTNEKEFLTRKETADYFKISLVCLHDWVKKGILKKYRVGNRAYFKHSELVETMLNSNRA